VEAPTQRREAVADHRWFDWVMAVLSAWLLGGAFVDGWAHTHEKVDTTFFTPWHAAFYTGFLAVAGALVGALVYQRARRGTWQQALHLRVLNASAPMQPHVPSCYLTLPVGVCTGSLCQPGARGCFLMHPAPWTAT
jgi:hypothetical protein